MISGIGDELIIVISSVMTVLGCYMAGSVLLNRIGLQVHPDMASAVQSTRRDMGMASDSTGPRLSENCPVCLSTVEHAIETNCGHRFCAECMLQYWRHDQWPRPARCPVCRRPVGRNRYLIYKIIINHLVINHDR